MSKTPVKLKTREIADKAQQYTRGKSAYERVKTIGEAIRSTKDTKAQQMLLRAQKAEMSGKARASMAAGKETEKLRELARGRSSAVTAARIKGPNAAAKSAYNRAEMKRLMK